MARLLDKKLVFVTGKGGVGKSTISLALGMAAAAEGKRAIVAEVGGQEQISQVMGMPEIGYSEQRLGDGLYGISIDPDRSTREYLLDQIPIPGMGELLHRSKIFSYLAAATPGLSELVTIGKVWELAQDERRAKGARGYDIVIVDAPATGHGIGFLQAPAAFADIARAGPIHNQASTLARYFSNPKKTGVALVARPEEMAINETIGLESRLAEEVGIDTDVVYLNGIYPDHFPDGDRSKLERGLAQAESGSPSEAAIRAALSLQRRASEQAEQGQRLREGVGAPIRELPFLFEPDAGAATVERLAGELV